MPEILWSLTAERDLSRIPATVREVLIARVGLLREYRSSGKLCKASGEPFDNSSFLVTASCISYFPRTVGFSSLPSVSHIHVRPRNAFATVYNWFTEGFDTKDLQEARALLEALSD